MKTSISLPALLRKRGVALILVVSVLSLMTILMLAMFSATDNEFKSTQGYVASQDARRLGDIAVNIDIAQLQQASLPVQNNITSRFITATQPGEVRTYGLDGSFMAAFKLYSAAQMQVLSGQGGADEGQLVTMDLPVTNWDSFPDRYVDLNEPIIRAAVNNSTLAAELYFPIVDPRSYRDPNPQVPNTTAPAMVNLEGFSYSRIAPDAGTTTSDGVSPGSLSVDGVVLPTGDQNQANAQRLPMPVTWLYVLQDGSLGTLDSSGHYVKAPGSSDATSTNPIVGRVAFWTDDESCKVNINTAAEATFWGTPRFFHEREHQWVEKPPTAYEYQRFPAHPSTVALSSVFFPDVNGINSFDLYGQTGTKLSDNMKKMHRIYDIVPKIARGGSDCGTKVYIKDDQTGFTEAQQVSMASSAAERLYASVDELFFSYDMNPSGSPPTRKLTDNWVPADVTEAATPVIDPGVYGRDLRKTLEQTRFFLTANSRAPEFSFLGVPKVCMWPISYYNDNDHRTVYDKLIAFCSTFKGKTTASANGKSNSYYFQRAKAHDSAYDIGLERNQDLMLYLQALVGKSMPQTSGSPTTGNSTTLAAKYGQDNINTVLVEIFDYIRSTNLYDDILSNKNVQSSTTGKSETQTYTDAPAEYYTYTNPLRYNHRTADIGGNPVQDRIVADDGWPGHGTVSPSVWNVGSSKYRGMARFFTLSEIGLHFICTADGGSNKVDSSPTKENDDHSYVEPITGNISGGRGAERINYTVVNQYMNEGRNNAYSYIPVDANKNISYWWSNYPPFPARDQYGTKTAKYQLPTTDNPNKHPGYDPANWNCTLEAGTPLPPGSKRIQALLDFEMFCPAEGWTLLNPEWTMVLDGQWINSITVNGSAVWSTAAQVILKSNKNLFSVNTNMGRSGGSVDPVAIYSGRRCNIIGNMPKDPGYDATAQGNVHGALDNCNLSSNFFTVGNTGTMTVKFPAGGGLKIKLFDTHNWQNANPIQQFTINFAGTSPTITTVTPELCRISTNKRTYISGGITHTQRAVDAPRWWSFSYGGCLGRYYRVAAINPGNIDNWTYAKETPESGNSPSLADADHQRTAGRFRLENDSTSTSSATSGQTPIFAGTAVPATAALIWGLPAGKTGVKNTDGILNDKVWGADVVRTVIPALGDYRLIASRYDVPATMWMPHRFWNTQFDSAGNPIYQAHNFCSHAGLDAGADANLNAATSLPVTWQFVRAYPPPNGTSASTLSNMSSRMPDIPQDPTSGPSPALSTLNNFLDFDNSQGDTRDGAYCNKPDEGNFSALNFVFSGQGEKTIRNGYFYQTYEMEPDKSSNDSYFTPNRLVSSPVMFGSLVTSVFDPPNGASSITGYNNQMGAYPLTNGGRPWQTLLFRPHVTPCSASLTGSAAFAGTSTPVTGALDTHPGAMNPPDHYLLDLFSMPVVEPYAISEPLSTAGRINLNYQIVPFTYIRRATGVYAAMKGELMRAISLSDNGNRQNPLTTGYTYKNAPTTANSATPFPTFPPVYFWAETGSPVATQQPAANNHYWHRRIDAAETTKQLDERFLMNANVPIKRRGLLRSSSQVCELHMIPSNYALDPTSGNYKVPSGMFAMPASTIKTRETNMQKFWSAHALTGDNTREEIYSHLYPKFTNRSNTFRVHVRAQAVKKSRASAADTFSSTAGDKVLSEYRGSYLLERYIDPNDTNNALPDYAARGGDPFSAPSLESFYRFHVLEVKRFAP